jgi:DNA-binding NarL/FixJ family response regulator
MIPPIGGTFTGLPRRDALLRELARSGESVANIAKHLNRSAGSVRNRALRQNIALAKSGRLKDLTGK